MKIWPEVDFNTGTVTDHSLITYYHTRLETFLRKKHEGKWYLIHFYRYWNDTTSMSINWAINAFNHDVYLFQLFGKIIPGHPSWGQLDPDQREEEERFIVKTC
jgi:hypothetical protein